MDFKQWIYRGLAALVAAIALVIGIFLCEAAFREVLSFRQLERIPASLITESLPGEVQLRGTAMVADKTLKAPKTNTETLYYRYLVEREERDSDGDTTWRTVSDEQRGVDFKLIDHSGELRVLAHQAANRINWSAPRLYFEEIGDYRYTEWRIDPRASVTLFGWLEFSPVQQVAFPLRDSYQPIITTFGAGAERADIAFTAILQLWGGLSALVFTCFAVVYVFRIHKTLVFLTLVSIVGSLVLLHYGYRSAEADVREGYARFEIQSERALTQSRKLVEPTGMTVVSFDFDLERPAFSGLSVDQKNQINAWRRNVYQIRERYLAQVDQFPERGMAKSLGLAEPPEVMLPLAELAKAQSEEAEFESTRTRGSVWWVVLLFLLAAGASFVAFRTIRTKRTLENIPTSKTAGVVYGLAEVAGELVADSQQLLEGPVSGEPCVWYHYVISEKRGSGKDASWHVVHDEIKKQPFLCQDDEGTIRIFPGKAECISRHHESRSSGNRRYSEYRFSPGDELYVLGKARLDKTTGESLVLGHEKGLPYIIANIPESEVMFRKAMMGLGFLGACVSLLFFGALQLSGANGNFSSIDFLLCSLVAPTFAFLVVLILMFNDLVFLRQRCERNWANIQVSLKKRADLVPQLEAVVKQYLAHERSLQESLVKLREQRQQIESVQDVDAYLKREFESIDSIKAQVEAYPDLKGMDLIAVFNRRLIKLENEVALIRAGYNDAVTAYQTRCQTFPDNLLARLFGFHPRDVLKFTQKAHEVPVVSVTS